jgi:hypothetical protein
MLITKPDFLPLVLAIFATLNSRLNNVSETNLGIADRDYLVLEIFTYASLCNTDPIPSPQKKNFKHKLRSNNIRLASINIHSVSPAPKRKQASGTSSNLSDAILYVAVKRG